MRSSGGGGYGDPLARDPERVRADVDFGYVSAARARDGYGVVFDNDGKVDSAATAKLRQELAARRLHLDVVADDTIDSYVGGKGRRRIATLCAVDASALGASADDLIEILGRNPAPLRAWVRIGDVPAGKYRLDSFGRKVLGVGEGDRVGLRRIATPPLPNGMKA